MQSRAFVPSIPLHKTSSTTSPIPLSNTSCKRPSRPSTITSTLSTPTGSSSSSSSSSSTDETSTTTKVKTNHVNPSPAEWLRANEASLRTRPDALRVAYISPQRNQNELQNTNYTRNYESSKPISIPTRPSSKRNNFNNSNSNNNNNNHSNNLNFNSISSLSSSLSSLSSTPSSTSKPSSFSTNSTIQLSSSPSALSRSTLISGIPRVSGALHMLTSTPPSYCPVGFDLKLAGQELDQRIFYLGPVARNKVVKAIEIAQLSNVSDHILAENLTVALIVADLQMDCDTVCAAILKSIVGINRQYNEKYIEQQVGMDVIKILKYHNQLEESVNLCVDSSFTELSFSNLRELILVRAVDEHRAISLELAKAVLAIRTIDTLPSDEMKKSIARRTMYLYAPLANQLGIWYVQSELEELAFMYLDSESFEMIRHLVGERRRECEDMLQESKQFLERILSQTVEIRNLIRTVHIKGRVKGLYSVYRKMRKSGKKVYEIYDLLALRVVVQPKKADEKAEKDACYAVRNVINQFYETFESRGKDYIEKPKNNGYRSLHMTVLPQGGSTPLEIQVRTEKMHHVAEFGAAAHWIYKESSANAEGDGQGEQPFDELEVEVDIKNSKKNDDDNDNELELDSDIESIISDSDSDNEDNFMFFNFEEGTNADSDNDDSTSARDNNDEASTITPSITTLGSTSIEATPKSLKLTTCVEDEGKTEEQKEQIKCENGNSDDEDDEDGDEDEDEDSSQNNDNNRKDDSRAWKGSPSKCKLKSSRMVSHKALNAMGRNAKHSVTIGNPSKIKQQQHEERKQQQRPQVILRGRKRQSKSTTSSYPRPRVPVRYNATSTVKTKTAQEQMNALELKRQTMRRHRVEDDDELQHELRSGYVSCLASAISASRVIVSTAGQLYGLARGSTLMDLASRLGVASLSAIAIVNGQIVPLTQRLNMNDIVQFINI